MTPPKFIMPYSFLRLKLFSIVPDHLFPLSCLCFLNLYVVSNLFDVHVFHVITKKFHLPFTPLFLISLFCLFPIIPLYSQNE